MASRRRQDQIYPGCISDEELASLAIPGSRFYRVYCAGCGEPMRASPEDHKVDGHVVGKYLPRLWCNDCTLKPQTGGRSGPLDEDSGGYQANARRELEETG